MSYYMVRSSQRFGHLLGNADLLDLVYIMFPCSFVTFLYGVLGQVWYLIVFIPNICLLPTLFVFAYHTKLVRSIITVLNDLRLS